MPAAHIQRATLIGVRPDLVPDLLAGEWTDQIVVVLVLQFSGIRMAVRHEPRPVVSLNDPVRPAAVDVVGSDQAFDQSDGLQRQVPKRTGMCAVNHALQIVLPDALTGAHLSAVAPRCTKAHPLGLQHHNVHARLRQMERR